jgi:hypothetical protein
MGLKQREKHPRRRLSAPGRRLAVMVGEECCDVYCAGFVMTCMVWFVSMFARHERRLRRAGKLVMIELCECWKLDAPSAGSAMSGRLVRTLKVNGENSTCCSPPPHHKFELKDHTGSTSVIKSPLDLKH